jgi:hypothetical protein
MNGATLRGGCHCGHLSFEARLARAASDYAPRACDCSFCRKHGAAWLSDPQGALHVRTRGEVTRYRQGSAQAEFIACPHCAVLVLVACDIGGRAHAALNVRAVAQDVAFAAEQTASPQQLQADAKRQRWEQVWFADVRFEPSAD